MASFREIVQFLRDVRSESERVQWPNGRQTLITTGVVVVFVLVTGLYLAGVDFLISLVMEAML